MIAERRPALSTIHVLLFATLLRFRPEARHGQPFELSFSEGDTLRDVLAVLDLPEYVVRHLFVNGERAALDYHPRDGDEVAIFPLSPEADPCRRSTKQSRFTRTS